MIDHIICWIGMNNDHLWHASNLWAQLQLVVPAREQDRRLVKVEQTRSVSKMAARTRKASRTTAWAGSTSCTAAWTRIASRTPVADGINVVATVTTDSPWNLTPSHWAVAVEPHTIDLVTTVEQHTSDWATTVGPWTYDSDPLSWSRTTPDPSHRRGTAHYRPNHRVEQMRRRDLLPTPGQTATWNRGADRIRASRRPNDEPLSAAEP
jgi:hypothetical protein